MHAGHYFAASLGVVLLHGCSLDFDRFGSATGANKLADASAMRADGGAVSTRPQLDSGVDASETGAHPEAGARPGDASVASATDGHVAAADAGSACVGLHPSGDANCAPNVTCKTGGKSCATHADCRDAAGTSYCVCEDGYEGDGSKCADVNECTLGTHDCDAQATCTNTAGSFSCACDKGWKGNGRTCTNVDECKNGSDDCDAHATCTDAPGTFTCACDAPWIGDGKTCPDLDTDGDEHLDADDDCPNVANPEQDDLDHDDIGDACDSDRDGDGSINALDNCPDAANSAQADADSDQVGDVCDPDIDGDTIANASDDCPTVSNVGQSDLDGDGSGYPCDPNDEVVGRGTLSAWDEGVTYQFDTLVGAHGSGIRAEWSAGNTAHGYVYADKAGLEVAASGATDFTQITNADTLTFDGHSASLDVGMIAVLRNTTQGTYAAIRIDSAAFDGTAWRANATWLFAGHSRDLSVVP